ncbi:hypothetical protein C5L14_03475 [Labrys okinawensis]|uniref:Lysozyme inhibitor LprI-like N-terminal domain-containing protein n=2 Tax=Labrys okinawensis TaxID=346911 RepID=A0A2S9QJV8_9HYPH|nr:hypothetical protein C5L14_03475 [Labrys okinawensis]
MRAFGGILAAGVLVVSTLPSHAADFHYSSLIGRWKVQGVKVAGNGVQALVNNDPQYMGAVVEFDAGKIIWVQGTKAKPIDPNTDNCNAAPKLTPADRNDPDAGYKVKGGYNILCGSQGWGPGAVVLPVQPDVVSLYWYDNGILSLKRESVAGTGSGSGSASAPAQVATAGRAAAAGATNCANAATQADMNECADKAFKKSDADLNAVYQQIEQRLKDNADTKKRLVAAQRAWVAFRDAECTFSASGASGGSIYPMVYSMCLDRVTQARVRSLEAYLSCGEGDTSCPVPTAN